LKRIYDDAIAYAFVTDVYVEDDLSEATINNGREFEVGDSVKYNS
jgi:ribosome-binding factor A